MGRQNQKTSETGFMSKGRMMLGIHAFPCFAAPLRRPIEQSMFNCHTFGFA
jgi:hypothetical protein